MVGGSRSSMFGLGLKVGVAENGSKKQLLITGKNGLKTSKMELRWVSSSKSSTKTPIFVSTKPSDVNPEELLHLYAACNHSSHRFPAEDDVVDLRKLRLALSHSSFLVSIFQIQDMRGLLTMARPKTSDSDSYSELVGFGRAVSDMGLTASIYDVMVTPSLQRMGIGRLIVQRLVRMITSRDIYDISALCSENERLFFKACGFGDDILASTTMMYTKSASTCPEGDQTVKRAGRKLLIVPPLKKFTLSKTKKSWNSSHDMPSLAVVELDID